MSVHKSGCGGNSSKSSCGSYSFVHDCKPCKGDSSSPDSVPELNWWLNHHGLGRCFSYDQLNVLDIDSKILAASCVNGNEKADSENQLIEEYYTTKAKNFAAFCSDVPLEQFCSQNKSKGDDCWLQEFESTISDDLLSNAHLMGLDSCSSLVFEQPKKLCSELDSHWIGLKKIEPWWHAVNRDDLTTLVSQTSSLHIRNRDQGVQSMLAKKASDNYVTSHDQFEEQMTYKEVLDTQEILVSVKDKVISFSEDCTQGNRASVSLDGSMGNRGLMECKLQDSDGCFSSREGSNTSKVEPQYTEEPSRDLSRAQLLEALCHSQTQAREAEKLAQEACDEKDHVINLFFQQASRLFAYRQWLRMLQLETLCLHLRSKDELSSIAPPVLSPLVGSKGMKIRKNRNRAAKRQTGKQRCHLRKYAFAFALGLSLAGAGLLVGWTIGWLFPASKLL